MPKPRALTAVALILLALVLAVPASAAPPAEAPTGPTSFAGVFLDLFDDLGATLTAWFAGEGSGVDPFGNHGTLSPPPEGSGVDPFGDHMGSGVDPFGGM